MDLSNVELRRQCHEVVDRLFAQHGWALLHRDEVVERALRAITPGVAPNLVYLVFGIYNEAMCRACSGEEGPVRWEQGYRELWAMLSAQARYRYPEIWEDAVQAALEITSQRIERCHVPQAFFQFAWGYVRNAVRGIRPRARRRGSSEELSLDVPAFHLLLGDLLPDPAPSVEERLVSAEERVELRALLDALEREFPRARRQLAAVRLKYLEGKEDAAIAAHLGVPVKRVHELRSLGLRRLRADPRLQRLFGDADADAEQARA